MKKTILIMMLLFGMFAGLIAQDVPPATPPTNPGVTTPPATPPIVPPIVPPVNPPINPLDDPKTKELINSMLADRLKQIEDDKKLTPIQIQEKALADQQKAHAEKENNFTKRENELTAKSYLLNEKINLPETFLTYLNISHADTETTVKSRVDGLKAAVDEYMKNTGLVKQTSFVNDKNSDDLNKQAAALAGISAQKQKSIWD